MEIANRLLRWILVCPILLGAALSSGSASAQERVIISEFMAANVRSIADRDRDYSDWIELYNAGAGAANLDGWFLTDTKKNLKKWRVPAVTMGPGEFLVIFASGKDRRAAGAELHTNFKLSANAATDMVVREGSYPGAFELRRDRARWLAYVRDAIVEPAIGRDIMALAPVRKPALLRQVFGACVASPAQVVSLQKLQGQLLDAGALETIAQYLGLLEEAFLVAPLKKYSPRLSRRRAAPPKLVVLNNAVLAVADPTLDLDSDPLRHGAWVENACLAHAYNSGQEVLYWREEPHSVDGVLQGSWGDWAIDVKTGRVEAEHLRGLAEFTSRWPKFKPLLLCDERKSTAAERAGIESESWREFLLDGPPR